MNHKCPGRAPRSLPGHRGRESGTHTPLMTAAGPSRRKERQREGRAFLCVGKWGFVGGSCTHPHAWWACVGRTGRKHGCTGGWIEELQSSRELQCFYASCYQYTDSFIFLGPGLHAHRRNHGKQRLAFLWWKVQLNVHNTFLFQPLFRVKSVVISAPQPDRLKVYMVYINVYSAHMGTVSALCGFWTQETSNSI